MRQYQSTHQDSRRPRTLCHVPHPKLPGDDPRRRCRKSGRSNGMILRRRMLTCSACCFDYVPFSKTTHCPNSPPHFFCLDCARRNAEVELGKAKLSFSDETDNRYELLCIDGSGCRAPFCDDEIRRFLPAKLFDTFEELRMHNEIRKVALLSI